MQVAKAAAAVAGAETAANMTDNNMKLDFASIDKSASMSPAQITYQPGMPEVIPSQTP